jgi:tetratricopeptide (TPR) repeat protein
MAISDDPISNEAWSLDEQARQAWGEGNFTRARECFEKTLAAWRSVGNTGEIEYALFHITQAMRLEPEYDPSKARPLLEEALQLGQQIGTDRYIKPAQFNLAWLELDTGNYEVAFTALQQLLAW